MSTISSIYDDYDLYSIVLGRDKDTKSFEALNSVIAAERLIALRTPSQQKIPLRVIELFSGRSEHRSYFLDYSEFDVDVYDGLDNASGTEGDVKYADAVTAEFNGYDLAIAHFYSLGCPIVKGATCIDRKDVVKHLSNVARNLNSLPYTCGYYIHLGDTGLGNTLNQVLTVADEVSVDEQNIRPNHPIRKRFDIPAYDPLKLRIESSVKFDRWTRTLSTRYSRITLLHNTSTHHKDMTFVHKLERQVHCWEIVEPFVFRTWSEDEMVDMLHEAGFRNALFFHNRRGQYADNSEHTELENVVTPEHLEGLDVNDEEELNAFNATEILALT